MRSRPTPPYLEGHVHPAARRPVLDLPAGPGHQRQPQARRQAICRHRRLPGRRARRHSASQPGQRHPHHRRPRQRAPLRRTDRRAAPDRSHHQPGQLQCTRPGSPQLVHPRAAQGRPRSRHRRREKRQDRRGLRLDAPGAGLRTARRPRQAYRGDRRRQSQYHRGSQYQPARCPALGQKGEGGARDVVAGRRRRLVHRQSAAGKVQPRRTPARYLGQTA